MNFEPMADRTWYLKENPKRVSEMCRIIENMRNESLKEGIKEEKRMTVIRVLADGMLTFEKIAKYAGLPLDEVKNRKQNNQINRDIGRESKNRFSALFYPKIQIFCEFD